MSMIFIMQSLALTGALGFANGEGLIFQRSNSMEQFQSPPRSNGLQWTISIQMAFLYLAAGEFASLSKGAQAPDSLKSHCLTIVVVSKHLKGRSGPVLVTFFTEF